MVILFVKKEKLLFYLLYGWYDFYGCITDCKEIVKVKNMLATQFELNDLGKLKYFLGIEMTC